MLRSEMIDILHDYLYYNHDNLEAGDLLSVIEEAGMQPPAIPVRLIKGDTYPYGAMCTMRCDCPDCNPGFLVNEWEPEDGFSKEKLIEAIKALDGVVARNKDEV